MKKLASVLVAGLGLTLLAGCNGGNTPAPAEATLSSIAISGAKTEYVVGDAFVKPTVTATYSDQTTKVVTNETEFSGFNSTAAATSQTITASYTEKNVTKTATYTVSIIALPEGLNTVEESIESIAQGYGWVDQTKYSSFKLDSVVTVSSSGGANTGKYFAATETYDDTYRLYASENAKLTISVSEGHVLKSVTLNWYVKDSGAVQGMTKNVAKDVTGKTSVDFTITSSSGNKGKIFISAITVDYYGEAGEDPFARDDWTAAEKTILSENFYGIDLPFVYFKGIQLVYDDYFEEYYVQVDNAKLADYRTYAAAFEANTSWENIDDEVPANNANYVGTKVTTDGNRYVTANLYLLDDDEGALIDNEDDTGTLYIVLADPYYYEWDNELIEGIMQYVGINTTATLVAYTGDFEFFALEYSDDDPLFTLYFPGQAEADFTTYKAAFTGWTVSEIKEEIIDEGTEDEFVIKSFTAIPASDDLFVKVEFYNDVVAITVEKYLPHLDEFPMTAVKAYNGGFDVDVIAGANYFTAEEIMGWEINPDATGWDDFFIEVSECYRVIAYGIDATEFAIFKATLEANCLKVTKYDIVDEDEQVIEGVEGYSVEMLVDAHLYYYSLQYDTDCETVTFDYKQDPGLNYSATWMSTAISAFLANYSITETVPELPLGSAEGYFYVAVVEEDYMVIFIDGLAETEWLAALRTAGWTVPTTPHEQWGYECRNAEDTIEVDIQQYDDDGQTYAYIYSAELVDSWAE